MAPPSLAEQPLSVADDHPAPPDATHRLRRRSPRFHRGHVGDHLGTSRGQEADHTWIDLISSYASMSLARIASSVLNARSAFSIAVMTPLTFSVLPAARSSTACVASCCRRVTSSMLFFSESAKLAPLAGAPEADLAAGAPTPLAPPRDVKLFVPLIMSPTGRFFLANDRADVQNNSR